jgi:hypothetical protein
MSGKPGFRTKWHWTGQVPENKFAVLAWETIKLVFRIYELCQHEIHAKQSKRRK